jgi:hypothetical protein
MEAMATHEVQRDKLTAPKFFARHAGSVSGSVRLCQINVLPVLEDGEDPQWIEWILFASDYRAVPSGAPRTNHTWEICHLALPNPGVESEGRRESVAGAPRRYGSDDPRPLAWRIVRGWHWMVRLTCIVCERAWFRD